MQRVAVATPSRRYDLRVPLAGRHQAENTAVAVGICEALAGAGLPLNPAAIARGIASVRWPARMETLPGNPVVLLDGAHNPFSMRRFKQSLREQLPSEHVILVFGANRSKDLDGMVAEIAPVARQVLAVQSRHPQIRPAACYSGGVLPVRRASRGGRRRRRRNRRRAPTRPPRGRDRSDRFTLHRGGGSGAPPGDNP